MYSQRHTSATTQHAMRFLRFGTHRMSRAHLALQSRPNVSSEAVQLVASIETTLRTLLGPQLTLRATLLPSVCMPPQALSACSAFAHIDLGAVNSHAVIELDLSFLSDLLQLFARERLGGPCPILELTRIEEAAAAYLCLTAVTATRRNPFFDVHFRPRLRCFTTSRQETLSQMDVRKPYFCIELELKVGNSFGHPKIFLPAAALQSFLLSVPTTSPPSLAPEILSAVIQARVFLGKSDIAAGGLERLSTGDVVTFESLTQSNHRLMGSARLHTPGFELHGHFENQGFRISHICSDALLPEVTQMTTLPPVTKLHPLPIEVEIELTRVRISLSELAQIQAGSILALHLSATDPVTLRIGDRSVARAELVDIDGQVGARILHLLS